MADFGSKLKNAREERGLSLQDIAATTKISPVALEALEHNDYSRLPGGIFSRAFVRAYALEVGLDAEAMVQEFLTDFVRHQRETERATRHHPVTAADRDFLERQRRALRLLRFVLMALALVALATLVYVAWVWWPAPDASARLALRPSSTRAAGPHAPFRPHL
jgi:cytoskeletal protein RodZ